MTVRLEGFLRVCIMVLGEKSDWGWNMSSKHSKTEQGEERTTSDEVHTTLDRAFTRIVGLKLLGFLLLCFNHVHGLF